jgi:hypothetical protein
VVDDRDRDAGVAVERSGDEASGRRLRALRERSWVKNAIRSPSSVTQTGTLCGPPSGSTVALCA